jgi:hypothetical protein
MNEGHDLGTEAKVYWNELHLGEERYNEIKEGLLSLKALCNSRSKLEKAEDAMLLEAMGDVLESLERTFIHHFGSRSGYVVSPKSNEPWD